MGFAGGFTYGTVSAGFELVGKRELPGGFGVANCEANRHLLGDRWETQVGEDTSWEPVDAEFVFGNPPCSGFSLISNKNFRGMNSPINACMWAFANYVSRVKPQVAAFESVTQAYTQGVELMRALHQRVLEQTGLPYRLYHVKHNNLAVGGCATRKRYFWVVSLVPFGVEHPRLSRVPTLWDAIGDLRRLDTTWEAQPYREPPSTWAARGRSETGAVDGHVHEFIPEFKRGLDLLHIAGPWREREIMRDVAKRYYERTGTLPESWKWKQEKVIANDFKLGFFQVIRWPKDEPSRVITGAGPSMVMHPTLERPFTHREVARIMGFPDDWHIRPLRDRSGLRMTWGKGIPVDSGRWLATWVRRSLLGSPGSISGTGDDSVGYLIDITKPERR